MNTHHNHQRSIPRTSTARWKRQQRERSRHCYWRSVLLTTLTVNQKQSGFSIRPLEKKYSFATTVGIMATLRADAVKRVGAVSVEKSDLSLCHAEVPEASAFIAERSTSIDIESALNTSTKKKNLSPSE